MHSSWTYQCSLLTLKSVNLVIAHDGLLAENFSLFFHNDYTVAFQVLLNWYWLVMG